MMFLILLSKHLDINPDNIATPIASSLGDLVTLIILAYCSSLLYDISELDGSNLYFTKNFICLFVCFNCRDSPMGSRLFGIHLYHSSAHFWFLRF